MNLEYFHVATEFIEFSKQAKSLKALGGAFSVSGRKLGFEHYAYVSSVEFATGTGGDIFLVDIADDQFESWCAEDYLSYAPQKSVELLEISFSSEAPFTWQVPPGVGGGVPSRMSLKCAEDSGDTLFGISVPVHVAGGLPGVVNMVGRQENIDSAAVHAVHLMSLHLHDAAQKLAKKEKRKSHPTIRLTPRERECMQWVVSGKTDWEISSILNISERTVHNHVESAKTKMGVKSRVQAVVRAYLGNLI